MKVGRTIFGVMIGALALAAPAQATITPTDNATTLANALNNNGVLGAASLTTPPHPDMDDPIPNATADNSPPLTGFPTNGTTYTIMTSGDPLLADDPNDSDSSGHSYDNSPVRGTSDKDVSVLTIPFTAPAMTTCLQFDFKFLSEEYPEFVGSQFNDAFLAEIDTDNWTTNSSGIVAPNNFVVDEQGHPVTINSTGSVTVRAENSFGTTYDAATRKLRISKPISSGAHTLYLSVFDQGDAAYDAAAFIDNLTTSTGTCTAGSVPIDSPGDTPPGGSGSVTNGDGEGTITVHLPPGGGSYVCQVVEVGNEENAPPYEPCTDGQELGPFVDGEYVLHIAKIGADGTPDNSPANFPVCIGVCTPPVSTPPGNPASAINPAGNVRKRKCKKKKKHASAAKKKCKKKKK